MIRRSERLLLDGGGTFIKCSDGRCIPVPSAGSRDDIAAALRQAIGSQSKIAVAIPGPFDYEKGIFIGLFLGNYASYEHIRRIVRIIQESGRHRSD